MTPNDVRSKYLEFFAAQGHAVVPSSTLVPDNDPTTLFTGSGMQPMVPYLLGEPHSKGTRIADSQKCFRSQDIEEVGDNRHTTFFEMLGNWSLGDYFKKEQLRWMFTFLTQEIGLDPQRLYVTVFGGNQQLGVPRDDEAVAIWQELFTEKGMTASAVENAEEHGMGDGRIFYYGEKKNWWSRAGVPANMPAGEPGGPDSEIFFDFGTELQLHENSAFAAEPCHVNCDCGRFLEIGNNVFMQFQKQADGSLVELAKKNVDFGGGLERILAAEHNNPDVFMTSMFKPMITELEKIAGRTYSGNERNFRVIADHLRAAVMLIGDGVYPANKEQGYFVRRLIRRSVRFGRLLGIQQLFLAQLVPAIASVYQGIYPEVSENVAKIQEVINTEEKKFHTAIDKGLRELEKLPAITTETAFWLYETYGFPFELTQELAAEKGVTLSKDDFEAEKRKHADQSRTASAGKFKGGLAEHSEVTTKYHTATHLLQAALRKILGSHVQQKGSNITAERLRFDFSHPTALTTEELKRIEQQINNWINQDLPVTSQQLPKEEALAQGAIAFFGEKYPDMVTVYTIGKDVNNDWVSKELCGGPHVDHTGVIGPVKIDKEKAAAAGVRRIYITLG